MSEQTGIALLDRNAALDVVAEALSNADVPVAGSFDELTAIAQTPDCLVVPDQPATDDRMAINGLELFSAATDQFDCPVVVYTRREGYEAIRSPIDAGAADVIRVPADRPRLITRRVAAAAGYDDTFRSSGEQIASLLRNYPHTLFLKDDVGRFENVSAHTANNYGFTRQQLIGMSDYELFSREHADELWEAEQEIIRTGEPEINAVEEYVDQDGERRWVSTTKVPRRGPDGTIVGIVGGTQDVTPAKQQEALMVALHEASRKLTRATTRPEIAAVATEIAAEMDNLPAVQVALADSNGTLQPVEEVTPANRTDTGDSSGEPAIFNRYRDAFARAYDTDTTQYVDASGALSTASAVVNPVFEGEFTAAEVAIVIPLSQYGVLGVAAPSGVVDEFTDRLAHVLAANVVAAFDRAERERELAEKNRRLEEFATLGAHELRNRLQVVLAAIARARSATGSDPLVHAEDTLDRMDRLLTQLLQLAKSGTIPRAVDAVDLRDVAIQVWDELDTPPEATLSPPPETPIVANRGALREIFEALFDNSIKHGLSTDPDSETITVDVGVTQSGFYVADDGVGIPVEKRSHLFDVEYAKSDDGYGLYIASALVDAHGWEIAVSESEAGGARFEITGVEFK